MSYTAKLVDVKPDQIFPHISVSTIQFYKDNSPFEIPDIERGLTKDQLINYCRQKIQKLEQDEAQQSGMADLISSPPLGDINIPSSAETINQAAESALQISIFKLSNLKQQIDLKVTTEDDPVYQEALLDAKNKKEILDILNS